LLTLTILCLNFWFLTKNLSMSYRPVRRTKLVRRTDGALVARRVKKRGASSLKKRKLLPSQRGFVTTAGDYGRFGLSGLLNGSVPEDKFFDNDDYGPIAPTGTRNLLFDVAQGVGPSVRVGRKCVVVSMQYYLTLSVPGFSLDNTGFIGDKVTLWIIQDRQCNGALAGIDDVFRNVGTPISMRFRNLANSQRFRILKRCEYVLKNSYEVTGVAFGGLYVRDSGFINLNIPFEFSGSTGSISEIKTNNLFMLISTDSTTDLVAYELTSRLKFTDL